MSKNSEPTDFVAMDTPEFVDAKGGSKRKLKRRWFGIAAVGIAIVAVVFFRAGMGSPITSTRQLSGPSGASAINFTLPSVTSSHLAVTLRRFRDRPLVINFWASWCVPCRTEMPLLERAYLSEDGKTAFVGIDTNDTPTAARAFLEQVHVRYPMASDTTGSLAIKYGLFGLPTTLFVSANGIVLGRHIGQFYVNTLHAALRQAFGE